MFLTDFDEILQWCPAASRHLQCDWGISCAFLAAERSSTGMQNTVGWWSTGGLINLDSDLHQKISGACFYMSYIIYHKKSIC